MQQMQSQAKAKHLNADGYIGVAFRKCYLLGLIVLMSVCPGLLIQFNFAVTGFFH